MKQLGLIIAIVIMLMIMVSACTPTAQQATDEPTSTQTPNTLATTAFERTAIARFTENPNFSASMTPFYGDILLNEFIRYITETPVFEPDRECYLVGDYWQLYDLADAIENSLQEIEISTTLIQAFVSVVWNISECDEYLIVRNSITVWLDKPVRLQSDKFDAMFISLLDVLLSETDDVPDISSEQAMIGFDIYFDTTTNQAINIETNRLEVSEALGNNLTGDELLEHLGGLRIINNP